MYINICLITNVYYLDIGCKEKASLQIINSVLMTLHQLFLVYEVPFDLSKQVRVDS